MNSSEVPFWLAGWVCNWRINSNKQVFLFILTQKIKPKNRFHLGWFKGAAWTEVRYKLSEHANINTKLLEAFQSSTVGYQHYPEKHKPTHSTGEGLLICCQYVIHNDCLGVRGFLSSDLNSVIYCGEALSGKIQRWVTIGHSTLIKHANHLLKHLLIGVREVLTLKSGNSPKFDQWSLILNWNATKC